MIEKPTWEEIGILTQRVRQLETVLEAISSGYEQKTLAPKMDGPFQTAHHLLGRERMRQIAKEALEDE